MLLSVLVINVKLSSLILVQWLMVMLVRLVIVLINVLCLVLVLVVVVLVGEVLVWIRLVCLVFLVCLQMLLILVLFRLGVVMQEFCGIEIVVVDFLLLGIWIRMMVLVLVVFLLLVCNVVNFLVFNGLLCVLVWLFRLISKMLIVLLLLLCFSEGVDMWKMLFLNDWILFYVILVLRMIVMVSVVEIV